MVLLSFLVSAYLIGSLPQVYLMMRLKGAGTPDGDLHEHLWNLSHKLGAIGFIVDLAKGVGVVLTGKALGFPQEAVALAGLLVVLGQMWPVYLLRSGGGGNSTAITMSLALSIYPFLIALIPVLIGLGWRVVSHIMKGQAAFGPPHSRSLPLSMFIAFFSLPISSWLLKESAATTFAFASLFAAIATKRLAKCVTSESAAQPLTARVIFKHFIFD